MAPHWFAGKRFGCTPKTIPFPKGAALLKVFSRITLIT
jgi:hypothetical protein